MFASERAKNWISFLMTETQLRGIEKFISAVMDETLPIIEERMKDKEFVELLRNIIFNETGSRQITSQSPKEKSIRIIVSGFIEIDATFQVLKDIPFYMNHFPPKHNSTSKIRFLNYHIGNYLNESYILRERLVSYQKAITRMYKKDHRLEEMKKSVANLELLVSGFDGIVKTRGKHVHQERYDDVDFKRLNFYELVTRENSDDRFESVIARLLPLALREYRMKWVKTISNNNDKVKEILDKYFDILYDVVFDKNGNWIDPNSKVGRVRREFCASERREQG